MRRPLVFALVVSALVTPAALHGQRSFEGVVTMRMNDNASGVSREMQYSVKGQKVRVDMDAEAQGTRMILDAATSKGMMIVPMMNAYMDIDLAAAGEAAEKGTVTRTGRKDRVAGHACEIIVVTDEQRNESEICGATDLGRFAMAEGRRGPPAWARGLGDFFPLRVSVKGDTVMEVTNIEPKSLDASLFVVPAGLKPMGNMGSPR